MRRSGTSPWRSIGIVALALGLGLGPAARPLAAQGLSSTKSAVAGCYRVELGAWENPDDALEFYRIPAEIRLDKCPPSRSWAGWGEGSGRSIPSRTWLAGQRLTWS